MYLPMRVEELISLSLNITYRIDELFVSDDPWISEERYYEHGTTTEINPPTWIFWLASPVIYFGIDLLNVYSMDTIQAVEIFDDETNDFAQNTLLLSDATINDSNKYQVCLGQFNTLTSVGYDISKVALINMVYESEGIYYKVSEDLLDSNTNIVIDDTEDSIFDTIKDKIDNLIGSGVEADNDNPTLFDEINNTSKLLFSGMVIILTIVLVIKIIDTRKRR